MKWWIVCSVVIALVTPSLADEKKKEPVAIKLRFETNVPKLPSGKAGFYQSNAKAEPGDRYFTENLLVLQPVTVTVVAKKKGDKINVRLAKFKWDEKHMEATTGADGKAILKTRTQGDLRIVVTSADGQPKPYLLVVWVGDEIKPDFKPVVSSMKAHKAKAGGAVPGVPGAKTGGGGSNTVGIIIAVVIGLGILVLVLKLRKRGMQ